MSFGPFAQSLEQDLPLPWVHVLAGVSATSAARTHTATSQALMAATVAIPTALAKTVAAVPRTGPVEEHLRVVLTTRNGLHAASMREAREAEDRQVAGARRTTSAGDRWEEFPIAWEALGRT